MIQVANAADNMRAISCLEKVMCTGGKKEFRFSV